MKLFSFVIFEPKPCSDQIHSSIKRSHRKTNELSFQFFTLIPGLLYYIYLTPPPQGQSGSSAAWSLRNHSLTQGHSQIGTEGQTPSSVWQKKLFLSDVLPSYFSKALGLFFLFLSVFLLLSDFLWCSQLWVQHFVCGCVCEWVCVCVCVLHACQQL